RTSNFRFEGYAGSLFVDAAFWTDLGRATSKRALSPCRTYSYGDGERANRRQPAGVIGTFLRVVPGKPLNDLGKMSMGRTVLALSGEGRVAVEPAPHRAPARINSPLQAQ